MTQTIDHLIVFSVLGRLQMLSLFALIATPMPTVGGLSPTWVPLPHVERRDVLLSGASLATANLITPPSWGAAPAKPSSLDGDDGLGTSISSQLPSLSSPRSVASVDSHPAIPVWPTWAGGRVVPVSLGGPQQDPFLLLAHHDHWFDPRDPLRSPFKAMGKALGLPYVDVEGFSMHPHRGFDILTYVLDGSDGFRHRDSLGDGSRTYRGGTAQWMRTGSGVLHEEFWETRPDRRTSIELFQLWVNLPANRKFDEPLVHYVGRDTDDPWHEVDLFDVADPKRKVGRVRDLGLTLDRATDAEARPPVRMMHVSLEPRAQWTVRVPRKHSALLYVRKGVASLPEPSSGSSSADGIFAKARQTATFAPDGDFIHLRNDQRGEKLDVLFLAAEPLGETVAQSGPIVMNTPGELDDAYRQLSQGTFLDRDQALRQQARTSGLHR